MRMRLGYKFFLAGSLLLSRLGAAQVIPEIPKVGLAKVPAIGDLVAFNTGRHTECMVASAQMYPCVLALVDGILYTISYRDDIGGGRVMCVETSDPRFKSPEGLRTGDVIEVKSNDEITGDPYFRYHLSRGKLWMPIVGYLGKVQVVTDGHADEAKYPYALQFPSGSVVKLRICGFVERDLLAADAQPPATPKL